MERGSEAGSQPGGGSGEGPRPPGGGSGEGPRRVPVDQLADLAGQALGVTAWRTISSAQVQAFADATSDHQWIHLDPVRAATGPFGRPIAHGFLSLSLTPSMILELLEVTGVGLVVNYGLNKVRFPAPVPVGSRVRGAVDLLAVEQVAGGVQATFRLTISVEGTEKPACVAEVVFRFYRQSPRP